jgi:thioredoxin-like negative regulator of GroEL
MNHAHPTKNFLIMFTIILFIAPFCCCTNGNKSHIKAITSAGQLNKITARAKNRLLMIDLFDESCMSCYMLFPLLEEIAREQKSNVTIYGISVNQNPEIAKTFNVTRRPHVVFVKNRKEVHAISGVHPKDTFVNVIEMYAR